MKYTIEGFSQEEVLKLGNLDVIDLIILRWIVDFEPNMTKKEIDEETYFWVNYQSLLEALPILKLGKRSLYDRLMKMCNLNILKHKNVKDNGNYSYYTFNENYMKLVQKQTSKDVKQTSEGLEDSFHTLMKTTSEQNNSSIKEIHLLNNSNTPYNPPEGESDNFSTQDDANNTHSKKSKEEIEEIDKYNFEIHWKYYPRKEGKTKAYQYYKQWVNDGRKINNKKIVLTDEQIGKAIDVYAEKVRYTEQKYIQMASTWFNTTILDYVDTE